MNVKDLDPKLFEPTCQVQVLVTFYDHGYHVNALMDVDSAADEESDKISIVAKSLRQVIIKHLHETLKNQNGEAPNGELTQ